MGKAPLLLLSLALLSGMTGPVPAHETSASEGVKLTGEILDMACYISHGGSGPKHAKCALRCAEMGQPIGLLASDGKVYLLAADHADSTAFDKAKTLAGQNVIIQGQPATRDGITILTVHDVKKK